MNMNASDWTTPEYIANITAEELRTVLDRLGVNVVHSFVDDDGLVNIVFNDIRDAEAMVSLGVTATARPGTLYDRASACCVSLMELAAADGSPDRDDVDELLRDGWKWTVHPVMIGRRMDWHVSVEMNTEDAQQLTANLNIMRKINP